MADELKKTGIEEAARLIEEAKRSGATMLDLSRLGLTEIPDSLAQLTKLREFRLYDSQISAIPDSLSQLKNLRHLNLSSNLVSAIPDSLAQLTNLRELYLYENQINAIPESLAKLKNLRKLSLTINKISVIPDSLSKLTKLRHLYLVDNQISVIPDALAGITGLQTLNFANNWISAIPDSLAQLTGLQTLNLATNRIVTIPDSLARLTNLRELNLADNQIDAIPDCLGSLENLTRLFLHGNSNLGIPDELLGSTYSSMEEPRPPKEILTYYFAQRAGSRPLNEAKLILIGRGGVGKTSLVNTLITCEFDPLEKTTEGIKIRDWPCEQVTLHIWDFGGQEMMHATHQFFLTARSIYLLVLTRRQGGYDEEADTWLRLIRAFGGKDAPVLIVLNKQKSEPFDVNRGGWLEKYADNIKGFVETDCADPRSITRLKEKIQDQLANLQSLKSQFPIRWFAIKDELAHMRADFVTFEEYRAMCRKHGEENPDLQNSLSGFLHDLGIALNYKDDPRLRFAYVLKPEWVTEGIYALLHAFVNSKGMFTPGEAEMVLSTKGYSENAVAFILGLMEQFELSFPLGDPQKRILIPQLLDEGQPDTVRDFKLTECLNFGYRYSIVSEGLLPRFIVRTHHLSDPATRWKSGVILKHFESGCRALVRADAAAREVRIHIDGPAGLRRDLLAIVRHNFDVIHADSGFKPENLVYPPGVPEKPLSVDELEILHPSQERIAVVLPDKSVIRPEIGALLSAVDTPTPKLKLFLSYSHQDEKFVNELKKDLKIMERNGLIRTWYDRALGAGEKWEARILQELDEADVIVCQLSRDFLASDFCVLTELETAIRRKKKLIAYVLKDCGWKEVPNLAQFQVLPRDAKPLVEWKNKDRYWRAIAEGIQASLATLNKRV